ncbi:nucleolar complex-associated protein-domain-containing protein [Peziza echinospora]|nr:nucleolar complex-associated protein-domain-containing protein [Peziza echinospora]
MDEDEEEDDEEGGPAKYEFKTRSWEKKEVNGDGNGRLPIKTSDGTITQVVVREANGKSDHVEKAAEIAEESEEGKEEVKKEPQLPLRVQILNAKEELASIAASLSEDPEENSHLFRRLREISQSPLVSVQKLALATQLAVYKSTIPGYRIRPLTAEEQKAKVGKDVKKVRAFEQALVHSYEQYVEKLGKLVRAPKTDFGNRTAVDLSKVAIACVCALLSAVPHFNFRGELLKIIIERLSSKSIDEGFVKARETLEELFRTDEEGTASLDAVRMLVKMFKTRRFHVHESVLNTFLSLRLLSELSVKASQERVEHEDGFPKKRKRGQDDPKKAFRTKRTKKMEKEQSAAMKELKEADAVVSHEEREKMQSETLKLVFITYFKILKERPDGNLMATTLEGLAKYAHLINIDFFTMLLTALKELIQDTTSLSSPYFPHTASSNSTTTHQPTRESLLCITTAFALLTGQSSDYHPLTSRTKTSALVPLDLTFFTSQLYTLLLPLSLNPDIELNNKSLHLPDPHNHQQQQQVFQKKRVNLATQVELLLRSLTSILTPALPPRPPPSRIVAFSKRMISMSLQVPEKSALATLGVVGEVGKRNHGKMSSVFRVGEKVGDGTFRLWLPEEEVDEEILDSDSESEDSGSEDDAEEDADKKEKKEKKAKEREAAASQLNGEGIEGIEERANPFAATAWEMDLLKKHYSPKVSGAAKEVVRAVLGAAGERATNGGKIGQHVKR